MGSISAPNRRISMELSREYDNGNQPMLIFDESEYLSRYADCCQSNTIYDYLKAHAA
jgi:hypothetical protein